MAYLYVIETIKIPSPVKNNNKKQQQIYTLSMKNIYCPLINSVKPLMRYKTTKYNMVFHVTVTN